ncbi:hypothetical protein Nepgr_022997 [Nepenthes gracilis]|uniref:Uncharacterized protein n=1 Tax=Nepenthes gracilis TaxID=150966 RepID=A0AAD3T0H2_NEPGR|nr:hypothetical protein Nepgr_022997 [Nepenthes gracilis]
MLLHLMLVGSACGFGVNFLSWPVLASDGSMMLLNWNAALAVNNVARQQLVGDTIAGWIADGLIGLWQICNADDLGLYMALASWFCCPLVTWGWLFAVVEALPRVPMTRCLWSWLHAQSRSGGSFGFVSTAEDGAAGFGIGAFCSHLLCASAVPLDTKDKSSTVQHQAILPQTTPAQNTGGATGPSFSIGQTCNCPEKRDQYWSQNKHSMVSEPAQCINSTGSSRSLQYSILANLGGSREVAQLREPVASTQHPAEGTCPST